ncbi:MAG: hypothetical protein ACM3YN_13425 [Parcubacteria group bacterium]
MRSVVIGAALAAMLGAPALAQGNAGFAVGDLVYAHEVLQKRAETTSMLESPGSPLGQLSKSSRTWIREETKRQSAQPTELSDLVASVHTVLAKDEDRIARAHRIDPMDVTRIVTLLITADAEDAAIRAMKKTQKEGDSAALQAAADRAAKATQNRKDAAAMQSEVSMALAQM